MSDEKRVRNANKALEHSMDTRQEVKLKLSMCSSRDPVLLERKVKELSAVNLNLKVSINLLSHMTHTPTSQRYMK